MRHGRLHCQEPAPQRPIRSDDRRGRKARRVRTLARGRDSQEQRKVAGNESRGGGDGRLVAGDFTREREPPAGEPDQGVKEEDGARRRRQAAPPQVTPAKMLQLVPEDHPQLG